MDVARVRADTPAVESIAFFNSAGSSLTPTPVLDSVIRHLRLEASVGGYEAAAEAAEDVDRVYEAGAQLLGCNRSELAFTNSASDSWWRAFRTVPFEAGDRVLVGHSEYVTGGLALIQLADLGVEVELIPDDEYGQVSVEALADALDERVRLVALTHVPTSGGLVNPAAEVGHLAKEAGAYYLLDACQAGGQIPLDVSDLRCDFLCLTGRKFLRGPRGTGLLYVNAGAMEDLEHPTFIDGRGADWTSPWEYRLQPGAQRYELFEHGCAGKIGLGVAIGYALDLGLDSIADRVFSLAASIRSGLAAIAGVDVVDQGIDKCGIVTFTLAGRDSAAVSGELRSLGVHTSAIGAQSAQFDLGMRGLESVVRASVHYFNDDGDIDQLLEQVAGLAR